MKLPAGLNVELIAGGVALLAVLYIVTKGAGAATKAAGSIIAGTGGLITGNNSLTTNATNAAGEPVTAYQGAGVLGTLGAAANTVSGGTLSSSGQGLGGWLYDVFHPGDTTADPGQSAPPTSVTDATTYPIDMGLGGSAW